MKDEKPVTPIVVGGIYETMDEGTTYRAVMTSVRTRTKGDRPSTFGTLERQGYAPQRMEQGSDTMNTWKLIYDPLAVVTEPGGAIVVEPVVPAEPAGPPAPVIPPKKVDAPKALTAAEKKKAAAEAKKAAEAPDGEV